MKRIETANDYSEFLIRARMTLLAITKAMNENKFDEGFFLAQELQATALLLAAAIKNESKK